jgi:hypothetical protein
VIKAFGARVRRTALLWITGDDIVFSDRSAFHGWRYWTHLEAMGDPAVAVLGGLLLFLIPSAGTRIGEAAAPRTTLLDWEFTQGRIPWGVCC